MSARFTLHSHILLFIALFDALITLLWSNCEKVREEAQKELVEYLKKTMSSIYDLVEEDFIHETSLSPLKHEIVRVLPFNFIVHEISYLVGLFFFRYSLSVFKPK